MCMESMMPPNDFIFCHPLLLLPSIFPSIRVFPSESALHIRWPKYWSFGFSISPMHCFTALDFIFTTRLSDASTLAQPLLSLWSCFSFLLLQHIGHLLTWRAHLLGSYLFACSLCSWGSQSKVIIKNEIMPFVAAWMDLEIIILSEVSQRDSCDLDLHNCPMWTPDWPPWGSDSFLLQPFAPCEPSFLTVLASVHLSWKSLFIPDATSRTAAYFHALSWPLNLWSSPFQGPFGSPWWALFWSLQNLESMALSSLFCSLRAWPVHLWSLCEGNYGKCLINHCVSVFFEIDLELIQRLHWW